MPHRVFQDFVSRCAPSAPPCAPCGGLWGSLAPQTRPKKGTDRQDTGPGNRTTTPMCDRGTRPEYQQCPPLFFEEPISNSGTPSEPQESISETSEQVSGPQIADDTRPGLGNTVRGFARGRRRLKQAPAWYFQLARREQWTTTG